MSTPPNAPTITTTGLYQSISVSWTNESGSGAVAYIVQWGQSASTEHIINDPNATSYTITGLANSTTYNVRVGSSNSFIVISWSPYVPTTTLSPVPGAPTNLIALSKQNGQVPLSWDAPSLDGGSPITNYIVQYGTDPNFATYITLTPNPTSVSATITGLTNGTLYYFRVIAQNANGSGPFSAPASATPSTVPGAPTGLTATSNENAQSTLSWTAPTSNGGLDITGYLVQYGTDSTFATYSTLSSPSSSPKSTVSKLTNGTLYYFRVAAINANPNSPGQYTAGISATPSTVPDPPTNLKATPGNAQVQLSWSSGLSDGGSPITNFKIEYKLSSSAWTGGGQYSMTIPLVIYFLKNGSSYDFRVSAINASGTSQPSDTANATPFLPFTTSCGIKGFVPGPPPWSRAGGNNCPNCVSNYGYAECGADNGLVYSTYALDQRHKAEILKYRSNSAQLSPSQQYSMMSRNAYTRKKSWATQTQTYTNPNVNNLPEIKNASGETVALQCNQPPVLCSMTSDSDVPGPVIPLCIDASVPLYNYKMQVTPASGGNFEPLNSSN